MRAPRVKPVNENFFLDIGEDPSENTPREIFGEVAYKSFVESYDSKGLIVGKYDIIERVRELKLLSLTADSGLLEALEAKGLTLSKLEKLLPLADSLGVLPLVAKNKDLLLALAPLIIEPAPVLLPLVASILKTPASNFLTPGVALLGAGAFETLDQHLLLAVPLILLGLPLTALGTILGSTIALPEVPTGSIATAAAISSSSAKSDRPVAKSRPAVAAAASTTTVAAVAVKPSAPAPPAPKVAAVKASAAPKVSAAGGGSQNGKRKVVKIKK
eukprot:CAMPEP_0170072974 /NCGR_PEP_ID=MMETSP0019_2-20121128/10480_1 /TAXON_ID=98059 /ORGANISM="Dinobryon sp., Strain UTEXLB2267" /LENGTH=272 /DNA_ID=CAMNT_0010282217 /DNA_START=110 /DNA_END=928 /DNA_ORIENTATION=-